MRSIRLLALIALALFAQSLPSAFAQSDEPGSMADAIAVGDPAASAPAYDPPSDYTYDGDAIGRSEYRALDQSQDLACEQTRLEYTCADTVQELTGAQDIPATRQHRQVRRGGGCAFGYNDLYTYKQEDWGGDVAILHPTGAWYNFGSGLNNETSSFITGNKKAHLSDFADGFGYWFPGDTSPCVFRANLFGTDWNNRISSRYRVPGS